MRDLSRFFNPRSTAVVGASKSPGKLGHSIVRNIINSGYKGIIYPINPKEEEILGWRCYPGIADLPEVPDLAVISIPVAGVAAVVEECGVKGIKNLVTITAGFKEVGREGLEREKELVKACEKYGINMLGPNCLGMMDTYTPINASFSAKSPLKGEIAFISQSGALCASILDWSLARGVGFSKFISLGNKAQLNEADFIEDAARDPYTRVIICYIENVMEGERFLRVAREASRLKPIVVLKSGISQAGAQAASSHTGALAGSDLAYETAFKQCGVLRARTMEEFFDLAIAFSTQPVPQGDLVAVITNSGGPGILAADSVETRGLKMARFGKETLTTLRSGLPAEANIYNPVDLIGDADTERFRFAINTALSDPAAQNALIMMTPTATTDDEAIANLIIETKTRFPATPILAVFMGGVSVEKGTDLLWKNNVPCYFSPERAVAALRGLTSYAEIRNRPDEKPATDYTDVDKERVRAVFDAVRRDNRLVLLGSETAEVAEAYRIPAAPSFLATTPDEAAQFAEKAGFPVVLKVASPKILHKTDVGGVKIGLDSADKVRKGFLDILDSVHRFLPNVQVYGVEVQKMMPRGRELIIGMSKDLVFGPQIMFGMGGIYVNLLKDVTFRLVNGLSRREIESMLAETKVYTLLRGYRGEAPSDIEALIEAIGRTAKLVMDFPEITELDINPLFAYEKGISALDVKITIS